MRFLETFYETIKIEPAKMKPVRFRQSPLNGIQKPAWSGRAGGVSVNYCSELNDLKFLDLACYRMDTT
jgi:hypothetical protein